MANAVIIRFKLIMYDSDNNKLTAKGILKLIKIKQTKLQYINLSDRIIIQIITIQGMMAYT